MRVNLSFESCLITISVGVLIVWVAEVSGTSIIVLKSAENSNLDGDHWSPQDPETAKHAFSIERGGLCSTAEVSLLFHDFGCYLEKSV